MILSRDAILAADDRAMLKVDVPEWGGSVYIKAISAREFADVAVLIQAKRPDLEVMGALLAKCLTDENGVQLFDDDAIDDLLDKSAAVVMRLGNEALTFNAITDDAMEDAAKN